MLTAVAAVPVNVCTEAPLTKSSVLLTESPVSGSEAVPEIEMLAPLPFQTITLVAAGEVIATLGGRFTNTLAVGVCALTPVLL